MKGIFSILCFGLFATSQASAQELNCAVQEQVDGETFYQVLQVPVTSDPHGSLQIFNLNKISHVTGFVAVLKGRAVINIYDQKSQIGSSSHAEVSADKVAHHQLMLPSDNSLAKAVIVDCKML